MKNKHTKLILAIIIIILLTIIAFLLLHKKTPSQEIIEEVMGEQTMLNIANDTSTSNIETVSETAEPKTVTSSASAQVQGNTNTQLSDNSNNTQSVTSAPVSYSDFVLTYDVQSASYCSGDGIVSYDFGMETNRDIRIKKIVVEASGMTSSQTVGIKYNSKPQPSVLKQADDKKWEWTSEIKLPPSFVNPSYVQIYASGSCGEDADIEAVIDEWVVWDYTANKPVKLQEN